MGRQNYSKIPRVIYTFTNWRLLHRTVLFQKMLLRIIGYPHSILRTYRQGIGFRNTSMARRHYLCD